MHDTFFIVQRLTLPTTAAGLPVLELSPFCARPGAARWAPASGGAGGWAGELFGRDGLSAAAGRCESVGLPELLPLLRGGGGGGGDPRLVEAGALALADVIFQLPARPMGLPRPGIGWAVLSSLRPAGWVEAGARDFAREHRLAWPG